MSGTTQRPMRSDSVNEITQTKKLEIKEYDITTNVQCWTALDSEKKHIHIESAKRGMTYFCEECDQPMIPVKGEVLSHHFRHKASEDEEVIYCGGEGFRHSRVKLFLHQMLENIVNKKYQLHGIQVNYEEKIGNERPDIVISSPESEILAIEIVDTHPPTKEKLDRWGGRMKVIEISNWNDKAFIDMSLLATKLISELIEFSNFISNVVVSKSEIYGYIDELRSNKEQIESNLENEIIEIKRKHLRQIEEIYESNNEELAEARRISEFPNIWPATFANINKNKDEKPKWGILVQSNNVVPEMGDFVLIRDRKGNIWKAILGKEVREFTRRGTNGFDIYYHLFEQGEKERSDEFKVMLRDMTTELLRGS